MAPIHSSGVRSTSRANALSLKYEIDNGAYPPILIPEVFAWENYTNVFKSATFFKFFWNSILVTGAATGLALLTGVPAGYGIARMKATKAAVVVLIARVTPALSYLIPLFLIFQWLGLMGTLWPQIITHLVITVPVVIWVMIGFFETTPMELEEAATIESLRILSYGCFVLGRFAHRGLLPVNFRSRRSHHSDSVNASDSSSMKMRPTRPTAL